MTISEWLHGAEHALRESGCPDPAIDSRWIAEDVLGMNAARLRFEDKHMPDEAQLQRLNELLHRRIAGEPVQYILNRADFMGLTLYVDARCLIPRADSETLVEAAIVDLRRRNKPRVLDLCTGSGAIGLSIATLVPDADVTLCDLSSAALEVARKNAHALRVDVHIHHGNLFAAVGKERFDLIACNPPYIRRSELHELQKEVRFEPLMALDGGVDGLEFYRRISEELDAHLSPGGSVFLEVGMGEAKDVADMLAHRLRPVSAGIQRDLGGVERVVWAKKSEE